jgi:hypothetical protein
MQVDVSYYKISFKKWNIGAFLPFLFNTNFECTYVFSNLKYIIIIYQNFNVRVCWASYILQPISNIFVTFFYYIKTSQFFLYYLLYIPHSWGPTSSGNISPILHFDSILDLYHPP